jgi:hypothetical protein
MGRQVFQAMAAAILVTGLSSSWAAGQTLTGSGPCPGVKTFNVTGATPNSRIGFIHAQNTGAFVIPGGQPCPGTVTGLAWPVVLAGFVPSDGSGNATVTAFIPAGFCNNRYLQVIDALPCTTSAVLLIN